MGNRLCERRQNENIQKRYIIMRNDRKEIFCGLARNYKFKPVEDIGDTPIKTYLSAKKAISSFESSWWKPDFEVEAVEIMETYESV